VKGEFAFAKNMDATNIEEIQAFLEESVKDSCEGLMVKMLKGEGSSYEPSKRSMNWLKVLSQPAHGCLIISRSRKTTLLGSEIPSI
jgi:ATP-dependent DNA ligase